MLKIILSYIQVYIVSKNWDDGNNKDIERILDLGKQMFRKVDH